jgi:hypothetical protein
MIPIPRFAMATPRKNWSRLLDEMAAMGEFLIEVQLGLCKQAPARSAVGTGEPRTPGMRDWLLQEVLSADLDESGRRQRALR